MTDSVTDAAKARAGGRPESAAADGVAQRVAAVVRPEIRALTAYHVPDAAGMVKIDAMENPYALPEALRAELGGAIAGVAVNRYPDSGAREVKALLRAQLALPDGVGIVLGNGSDELIQVITTAVARPGAALLSVEPSFVMYRMNAVYAGMRHVGVPLREDFSLDVEAMLAAIDRERPLVTFVAYPNNPTGNRFERSDVERLVRASRGLVVVDEAYYAFADDSFLDAVEGFPNLIVLRTVSKIGLAGIRLGYAIGAQPWIAELDKIRGPYNVGSLTQAAALAVLPHRDVLDAQAAAIRRERGRLIERLSRLPGTTPFPSECNFVLCRVKQADRVDAGLKERRILVKNLNGAHPLLAECLRFTVGTPQENDALFDAMEALCR